MLHITHSSAETEQYAKSIALSLADGTNAPHFIALYGDLGTGKTAFVRGFTSVMVPGASVKSPTFSIVREYLNGPCSVFHFDMYRIESEDDLYNIGFEDYLSRPGFVIVEWSENIPFALPDHYLKISFTKDSQDENTRYIETLEIGKRGTNADLSS